MKKNYSYGLARTPSPAIVAPISDADTPDFFHDFELTNANVCKSIRTRKKTKKKNEKGNRASPIDTSLVNQIKTRLTNKFSYKKRQYNYLKLST